MCSISVAQWKLLSPTFRSPRDCGPPGSSVIGILQAGVLEWVAVPFSRGSSWPRDWTGSPELLSGSLPPELPKSPVAQMLSNLTCPFWVDIWVASMNLDYKKCCREGGLGWGRHVNSRTFHFNVWQNSLQIKKKKEKKKIIIIPSMPPPGLTAPSQPHHLPDAEN